MIHAASDPRHSASVDIEGTRRLVDALRAGACRHLIYVSIVGVDKIPLRYYQHKHQAEQIVRTSGIPWSILRATQFHQFVSGLLAMAARVPALMPLPKGFRFQTVHVDEAAGRLLRCLDAGPSLRVDEFGGPEVLTLHDMAREWVAARGLRRKIMDVPVPGGTAAAFRAGINLPSAGDRGSIRWADWLSGMLYSA